MRSSPLHSESDPSPPFFFHHGWIQNGAACTSNPSPIAIWLSSSTFLTETSKNHHSTSSKNLFNTTVIYLFCCLWLFILTFFLSTSFRMMPSLLLMLPNAHFPMSVLLGWSFKSRLITEYHSSLSCNVSFFLLVKRGWCCWWECTWCSHLGVIIWPNSSIPSTYS